MEIYCNIYLRLGKLFLLGLSIGALCIGLYKARKIRIVSSTTKTTTKAARPTAVWLRLVYQAAGYIDEAQNEGMLYKTTDMNWTELRWLVK